MVRPLAQLKAFGYGSWSNFSIGGAAFMIIALLIYSAYNKRLSALYNQEKAKK